ncbi:unnamed protein product [Albugo candida]|uniref:Calcineurin-like phosphoesterase domain-containing protein n=1 Tax=Albugo candida TaxID=65357 RepID=A0A024FV24_9STRA|nr:unnamed protein product [Albugo candida]|eukprot:CCI10787.1 unnamed protein product [Albugo candida]
MKPLLMSISILLVYIQSVHSNDNESRQITYNGHKHAISLTVLPKEGGNAIRHVNMDIGRPNNEVNFIVLGSTGIPSMAKFHEALKVKLGEMKHLIDFAVMTGNNFEKEGPSGCRDKKWNVDWLERLDVENLDVPWFSVPGENEMKSKLRVQYDSYKCQGVYSLSKYWVTPSESYLLTINKRFQILFTNTNVCPPNFNQVIRKINTNKPHIVVGHHPMEAAKKKGEFGNPKGWLQRNSLVVKEIHKQEFQRTYVAISSLYNILRKIRKHILYLGVVAVSYRRHSRTSRPLANTFLSNILKI